MPRRDLAGAIDVARPGDEVAPGDEVRPGDDVRPRDNVRPGHLAGSMSDLRTSTPSSLLGAVGVASVEVRVFQSHTRGFNPYGGCGASAGDTD